MTSVLRIGVDARELLGDTTGVGRYLGELMRRWTARDDAGVRRFVLYTPGALPLAFPPDTVEQRIIGSRDAVPGGSRPASPRCPRATGRTYSSRPAYTAPLAVGTPLAVTIHDISFIAHPEWFRRANGGAAGRSRTDGGGRVDYLHRFGVLTTRAGDGSRFSRSVWVIAPGVSCPTRDPGSALDRRSHAGSRTRDLSPAAGIRWCCTSGRSSTGGGCRI